MSINKVQEGRQGLSQGQVYVKGEKLGSYDISCISFISSDDYCIASGLWGIIDRFIFVVTHLFTKYVKVVAKEVTYYVSKETFAGMFSSANVMEAQTLKTTMKVLTYLGYDLFETLLSALDQCSLKEFDKAILKTLKLEVPHHLNALKDAIKKHLIDENELAELLRDLKPTDEVKRVILRLAVGIYNFPELFVVKADLSHIDANGQTLLHNAGSESAYNGMVQLVAESEVKDRRGKTALTCLRDRQNIAAYLNDRKKYTINEVATWGCAETLGLALRNAKADPGSDLMHYAASGGDERSVALLYKNGFDIDAKDANGATPLQHALRQSNTMTTTALLERGTTVDSGAMGEACSIELVDLLMGYGYQPTATELERYSDLVRGHLVSNYVQKKEKLLEEALTNKYENTALLLIGEKKQEEIASLAVENKCWKVVGKLLDSGYVFSFDQLDEFPLFLIEKLDDQEKLLETAIRKKKTNLAVGLLGAVKSLSKELIVHAILSEDDQVLIALLAREIRFEKGVSILHLIVENGSDELLKKLASKTPDLDVRDQTGCTPLHFAVRENATEKVAILIAVGASVDAITINGNSPLHSAAVRGYNGIVSLLLEREANPNLDNHKEQTPLEVAKERKLYDTMVLLLEGGATIKHHFKAMGEAVVHKAHRRNKLADLIIKQAQRKSSK